MAGANTLLGSVADSRAAMLPTLGHLIADRPRIAVLSAGQSLSGGDRVLAQVTRALQTGADVTWLVPRGRNLPHVPWFDTIAVETVRSRARFRSSLEIALRSRRYDQVIASSPVLAAVAQLAGIRRRGTVTWFHQGWAPAVDRSRPTLALFRLLEAALIRTRVRTIVVSEALHRDVPHATLLRNGIDLQVYRPGPERAEVRKVGSILSSGKVYLLSELLAVKAELRKTFPAVELEVLTPKPLPFGEVQTVDGSSTEPSDFLRGCDVFVSVAQQDGFGLPPLEAMACGVPVVAAPSGGLLAYAQHGRNALVAESGNPAEVAQLIERVIGSAELRSQLRANGLQTAEAYSLERAETAYRAYFLDEAGPARA